MANLLIIKDLAKQQNISLKDLASQAGISEQGIHRIIRDNSTTIETLERIAAILNVSPRIFFESGQTQFYVTGVNVTDENHGKQVVNINDKALDILGKQLDTKDVQIDRLLVLLEKGKD